MVGWLFGCQEPFDADRHDLSGFRIAAVRISLPSEEELLPRAAVIVHGRPWAAEAATLDWYQVADEDALEAIDDTTPVTATGPNPTLEVRDDLPVLALVARHGGLEERAFGVLDPLVDAGVFYGVAATTDAGEIVDGVARGATVRLTAEVGPPRGSVQWMATGGTFDELAPLVTDWTADVPADGAVTIVALLLGEKGGTAWQARELHAGTPEPGLWIGQRWLPTDVVVEVEEGEAVTGLLVADDRSPIGVAMVGPVVVPIEGITWGTEELDCVIAVEGPFDPDWLLRQVCGRDGVVDRVVGVEPEVAR